MHNQPTQMVFIKMQGQSQASDCAVIRALKWTGEVKQKHMLIFKHCLKWLLQIRQNGHGKALP